MAIVKTASVLHVPMLLLPITVVCYTGIQRTEASVFSWWWRRGADTTGSSAVFWRRQLWGDVLIRSTLASFTASASTELHCSHTAICQLAHVSATDASSTRTAAAAATTTTNVSHRSTWHRRHWCPNINTLRITRTSYWYH